MELSAVVGGTWRGTTTKFVLREPLRVRVCPLGPPQPEVEPAPAAARHRRPEVEVSFEGALSQEGVAPRRAEGPLLDEARLRGAALEVVIVLEAEGLAEGDRPEVAEAFGRASRRKATTKEILISVKTKKSIMKTRRNSRLRRPR